MLFEMIRARIGVMAFFSTEERRERGSEVR
jgi:hypothetical protein